MEENNAYQAPQTDPSVEDKPEAWHPLTYSGPTSCDTGMGVKWLSKGFELFKASPGPWIGTMVVGFIIMMVIQLIPLVGQFIAPFTTFIWSGGILLGCKALRNGEKFSVSYLFEGFKTHLIPLVLLSAINFLCIIVVMGLVLGSMYFDLVAGNELDPNTVMQASFWIKMLIAFAALIPVGMAMWFAPALIVFHNMSIKSAITASFKGCLKNVLPFLVYGIVLFVLYILALIPLLLGLLVLAPTFFASVYASYEDIFTSQSEETIEA